MRFIDPTPTTLQQVPLEVWKIIISYTLSYPFMSPSTSSLIQNIRLLEHDCEDFKHSEKYARLRLRLVCYTWNEITKSLPKVRDFWRGMPGSAPPYSLSRVEVSTNLRWDACNCYQISFESHCGYTGGSKQIPHPEVDVLIDEDNYRPIRQLMQDFPNLCAFSGWENEFESIISANPGLFCNLTYLKLGPLWMDKENLHPLGLSHLHTLTIDYAPEWTGDQLRRALQMKDPPQDRHLYYSIWMMPNLRYLSIIGKVYSSAPSAEYLDERFNFLLEKIGSRLQGLSFTLARIDWRDEIAYALPSGAWKCCPSLKTVHVYFLGLLRNAGPPTFYPSIEVILYDFVSLARWKLAWLENYRDEIFLSLYRSFQWPVKTFGMSISWCTLRKELEGRSFSKFSEEPPFLLWFFDRIRWGARDFHDRHGEGIDSEIANDLMQWLHSLSPDPILQRPLFDWECEESEEEAEFTDNEEDNTSLDENENEQSAMSGDDDTDYEDEGANDEADQVVSAYALRSRAMLNKQ
ncbi:hypothetical protein CPB86DRAFT_875433 [Serendipita vermifera]|nr:hypothetical protein CPB86DRAFT_875433 [Serendipita vermifera]